MKFIDLFSGLGGFHVGLAQHGHSCVFSCEIDPDLRKLYKINHDLVPHDDIRTIKEENIPEQIFCVQAFHVNLFLLLVRRKGLNVLSLEN